jgi:hypothetical protein
MSGMNDAMWEIINKLPPSELKDKMTTMQQRKECGCCPGCSEPIDSDQLKEWDNTYQKIYKTTGFCKPCAAKAKLEVLFP